MREIKCLMCDKITQNKSFCCRTCYYKYQSLYPNVGSYQKGHTRTRGKDNANWKGDNVGYHALHGWVNLRLGKPKLCSICGTTKAKKYEWANISGKYQRTKKDWERLCVSCHRKKDGHANKMWKTRRCLR